MRRYVITIRQDVIDKLVGRVEFKKERDNFVFNNLALFDSVEEELNIKYGDYDTSRRFFRKKDKVKAGDKFVITLRGKS
jgi:hypothetical protein